MLNLLSNSGADSGFDRIKKARGACRGAVGLVKSRKKIVATNFAKARCHQDSALAAESMAA